VPLAAPRLSRGNTQLLPVVRLAKRETQQSLQRNLENKHFTG
jgi:hypothetical protein